MADIEKGINPENFRFQAPTENVDGSPITQALTYSVYTYDELETNPTLFLQLPSTLNQDVDGLYVVPIEDFPVGRSVVALTATDEDGEESDFSNTLGFRITDGVAPNAPLLVAS